MGLGLENMCIYRVSMEEEIGFLFLFFQKSIINKRKKREIIKRKEKKGEIGVPTTTTVGHRNPRYQIYQNL